MKIGLVGDTHLPRFGRRIPLALANGLREERVELIVHVGDFTGPEVPALFEAIAPLEAVAGNNDPPALRERFGHRKILDVAGTRLGVIHGDGRAGTTVSRSRAAFADDPVDVICFGHSHQPLCERRDSVWLVNPGSPTDKRRQPRYSYAILDIEGGSGRAAPRLLRRPAVTPVTPASWLHEAVQLGRRHGAVEVAEGALVLHLAGRVDQAAHRRAIERGGEADALARRPPPARPP